MKFIRKALLPAVIAAGFLGFLGAVGGTVSSVSAADGDVCKITGPLFIEEGETADYKAYVENPFESSLIVPQEEEPRRNEGREVDVDLNDFDGGDTDITSLFGDDLPSPTDFLNDVDLDPADNTCGTSDADLIKALAADLFDFLIQGDEDGEICQAGLGPATQCQTPSPVDQGPGDAFLSNGINDNDIDCGYVAVLLGGDQQCVISAAMLQVVANKLAAAMFDDGIGTCADDVSGLADNIALENNATEFVSFQIEDYIQDLGYQVCVEDDGVDGFVWVDVTCDDPGVFDLSFAVEDGGSASIEVVCGSDVETAEIFSRPSTVEINPSLANVAHSIIWIVLKGNNGEVAFPGTEVQWNTDRCAIEASQVDTEAEYEAANTGGGGVFNNLNPLNPASAATVESSVFAVNGPDSASRQQEEANTFLVTGNSDPFAESTISAVILHCDPIHAPGVTPGPAVVTAYIERGDNDIDDEDLDGSSSDNDDLILKTTVTVVGPPAANGVTVTAAPSTLACGEKATITVDVKDAAGQPVSDHTWVEAVTNAGGVLAGTGAVAGQAGLVSPVSSTVAGTFGGKATIYLLTSTAHVGKYEVVITTGGGGGVTGQLLNGSIPLTTNLLGGLFTTAPISVQVTVECSVAVLAAAPSTTAPRTGQGITPPSTGDAGLASSNGSSLVLFAIAGVVAVIAAGFVTKVVREEN